MSLNYIWEAEFYGYSLISFGDLIHGDFPQLVPIRRWEISPDREVLSTQPYIPTGIMFNDPSAVSPEGISYYDWSLYITTDSENGVSPCGYGLLYKVSLCEILMRSLLGWNASFTELFGMPYRHAKTTKKQGDPEYDNLYRAMDEMGSSAFLITDPQDEVEFINGDSKGTGWQSYDNFETRLKKAVSYLILGHKDAGDSTPGKLGSEQGGEESPIAKSLKEIEGIDTDFIETWVNDLYLPKLINLGFRIPKGHRFAFKNDKEKEDMRKREDANNKVTAEIAQTMKNAGMKMDAAYFTERTGIPAEEIEEKPEEKQFPQKIKNKLMLTYGDED